MTSSKVVERHGESAGPHLKGTLVHSACLCVALTLVAAEPAKSDSELVQAWLAVSLKHAQDYTICPADNPDELFSMMPHAIFRHSQPIRGDDLDDKEV